MVGVIFLVEVSIVALSSVLAKGFLGKVLFFGGGYIANVYFL